MVCWVQRYIGCSGVLGAEVYRCIVYRYRGVGAVVRV